MVWKIYRQSHILGHIAHIKSSMLCQVLKFFLYIFLCKNHTSSFWPHPTYDNHGVNKLIFNWIQTCWGCFHTSSNLNSFQEKGFLSFSSIYCIAMQICNLRYGPTHTRVSWFEQTLNSPRMPLNKFQLFGGLALRRVFFFKFPTSKYFPFERDGSLF